MTRFPTTASEPAGHALGLVVLQADETIERDFRRLIPQTVDLLVTRVPSGTDVTPGTLAEMEHHVTAAARLLPRFRRFDALAYACTSGAAQIGPAAIAARLHAGAETAHATDPVTALAAACRAQGIARLALLSPYVAAVSDRLRTVLGGAGIATDTFGTFAEPQEARVARIYETSTLEAGLALARGTDVQGLFLSCTNLRTLNAIAPLQARLGIPVLSSNLVLAWHMLTLAGAFTGTPADLLLAPQPPGSLRSTSTG